jgi:hypothetical protein
VATVGNSKLRVWYPLLIYGGLAFVVLGNIFRQRSEDEFPTFTLIYPGALAIASGVACGCILLYRSWRCVARLATQFDTNKKPLDPAAAVALTILPVVNLVGMFFSLGQLPGELNWLARAAGVKDRVPRNLGTAAAVVALCAMIPVVGTLFAAVTGLILIPVVIVSCSRLADAIENRLLLSVGEADHA